MKERLFHPILNGKPFDVFEVACVMGDHSQSFCFGGTSDEQIEVFDFSSRIPKTNALLGENVHRFGKRNNLNIRHKIGNLLKILLSPLALVGANNQFGTTTSVT